MTGPALSRQSPNYGGRLGYGVFYGLIRAFGVVPAYLLLAFVVPYYVLLRPAARRSAAHYLARRFPTRGALWRLLATFRYFYRFGQTLVDQGATGYLGIDRFHIEFPGAARLDRILARRRGIVFLTSHVGTWQSAMAWFEHFDAPIHFQFRREEHTRGRHFFDVADQGADIHIIPPDGFSGGMIELTNALFRRECVALMGDRAFGARTARATFLGAPAAFPIAPYHLARATGADLVVFFAVRTGRLRFRVECVHIDNGRQRPGETRAERIERLLGRYVRCLERRLLESPYMWFNFFDFWNGAKQTPAP